LVFTIFTRFKPQVWQKQVFARRNPTLVYSKQTVDQITRMTVYVMRAELCTYLMSKHEFCNKKCVVDKID